MYVVDGASNIVYSFIHVYDDLDSANSIVIGSDGKTFTGPQAKDAKVLYSGTSLKSPITATLLPNGNLVVGNTGSNTLVEIATNGKRAGDQNGRQRREGGHLRPRRDRFERYEHANLLQRR